MSLNTQYNIVAKDTEVTKATLKAVADASVNDEVLFSKFADFLADDFLQEVVVSASMIRSRAGFLAEIAECHDIRKLAEAAAADPVLMDALFDLAAAQGDLLTRLAEVIRTANGIAAAGPTAPRSLRAQQRSLLDPEAVVRIAAVREGAGSGLGSPIGFWASARDVPSERLIRPSSRTTSDRRGAQDAAGTAAKRYARASRAAAHRRRDEALVVDKVGPVPALGREKRKFDQLIGSHRASFSGFTGLYVQAPGTG